MKWIDPAMAVLFSGLAAYSGYKYEILAYALASATSIVWLVLACLNIVNKQTENKTENG